jgi:hypothetical protein
MQMANLFMIAIFIALIVVPIDELLTWVHHAYGATAYGAVFTVIILAAIGGIALVLTYLFGGQKAFTPRQQRRWFAKYNLHGAPNLMTRFPDYEKVYVHAHQVLDFLVRKYGWNGSTWEWSADVLLQRLTAIPHNDKVDKWHQRYRSLDQVFTRSFLDQEWNWVTPEDQQLLKSTLHRVWAAYSWYTCGMYDSVKTYDFYQLQAIYRGLSARQLQAAEAAMQRFVDAAKGLVKAKERRLAMEEEMSPQQAAYFEEDSLFINAALTVAPSPVLNEKEGITNG